MDIKAGWLIALAVIAVVGLAAVLAIASLARAARDDAKPVPAGAGRGRVGGGGKAAPAVAVGGTTEREGLLRERYSRGDIGLEEYRRELRELRAHG